MLVKKSNSKVSIPTVIQSSSSQTLDEDKDLNGPGKWLLKTRVFYRVQGHWDGSYVWVARIFLGNKLVIQNLVNEVQFSEPVGMKPKASKSQMSLSQHSQHSSSRHSQGKKKF